MNDIQPLILSARKYGLPVWCEVLLFLHLHGAKCISDAARGTDRTYSHVVKTIHFLEERKFITTKLEGRDRIVRLTTDGQAAAMRLQEFVEFTNGSRTTTGGYQ